MTTVIECRNVSSSYLIFETRTSIIDNEYVGIFDVDNTGARVIVRADSNMSDYRKYNRNNCLYLDMSIMDDDDFDYTVEFYCNDFNDFIYKLELLIDWMKDIRGTKIFYNDLIKSIPYPLVDSVI